VNQYLALLIQKGHYKRAIEAKYTFIKHMKKQGTVDHQIRRSYIEILCILIINEDYKKIDDTLTSFQEDVGGSVYSTDEYTIATQIKEAVEQGDFAKL